MDKIDLDGFNLEGFFDSIMQGASTIKSKDELYHFLSAVNQTMIDCIAKDKGTPIAGLFVTQTYLNAWHDCKTDDIELIMAAWINQIESVKKDAQNYLKQEVKKK